MPELDPAAVMAAHKGHCASSLRPGGCSVNPGYRETPDNRCEHYRLAEALAAEQARSADRLDAVRWMSDQVGTLRRSLDQFLREQRA